MKNVKPKVIIALVASFSTIFTVCSAQIYITKSPDLGDYNFPLSPDGGSYLYSDSFVAPEDSTVVSLGTWLNTLTYDPSTTVTFQVWGSVDNNALSGPDYANILATTAGISGMKGGLTFYSGTTPGSLSLTAGDTYWFTATVVGATGVGSYQDGGHTQNSGGITDNGTFWYSNDPSGQTFTGEGAITEMAFQVELASVPEPTTMAILGGSLMTLVMIRRRK